ncbi:MAG: RpiB/LacA/LacB family sugar-phosphate isomerase [Candidatus Taylorbacteria bacterium]|nr:RpiB/LacA/LacB family sugar-phosphate isomerase [Candidatus Taylorbacteria bacterium]
MRLILAADHAGFKLKEAIKALLQSEKYEVLDVGAHEFIDGDDYPVYMTAAAMKVAEDLTGETKAILFGGSGQGEAIVANRFPGVRAVVWYGGNTDIIRLSREHNDANVLSIGARCVNEDDAKRAVLQWLSTSFTNEERHARRNNLIDNIE